LSVDASVEKSHSAWQPFTPRGVAAFALAPSRRLLLVQLVCALLAAAAVVGFLHQSWFPVIEQAINQLPSEGEIRSQRLSWRGDSPVNLAENRFLAITVDLNHVGGVRSPAHVQVEFGKTGVKILSLLGSLEGSYPASWRIAFSRGELVPWWGAWGPPILAIVAGCVLLWLMLSWALLASLYCVPAWLIGFFANRQLSLRGSWRLAGAALMPGAMFFTAAVLFYDFGAVDLVRLAAAAAAHFIIGWVYVVASALSSTPLTGIVPEKVNPFGRATHEQSQSGEQTNPE